jgi:hypothetical protein
MGRAKEVDDWFARYENPMKPVVARMREIILAVDPRVRECIKWQAPTFTFEGNIASFFPKSKHHASLMFHQGAKIPGHHSILEGSGGTARFVKMASLEEADERASELGAVIRAWIDMKTGAATAIPETKPMKKPSSKTAATKKCGMTTKKKAAKRKAPFSR